MLNFKYGFFLITEEHAFIIENKISTEEWSKKKKKSPIILTYSSFEKNIELDN